MDLPTLTNQKIHTKKSVNESYACYELNFGFFPPNKLQKKLFKIVNNSDKTIYKFHLPGTEKLIFIPSIGHLKPHSVKEIIATYLTKEPINLIKVRTL